MKIIVLNCGSSSIKYQLYDMPSEQVIAKGLVEKIGLKGSAIKHWRNDGLEKKTGRGNFGPPAGHRIFIGCAHQ